MWILHKNQVKNKSNIKSQQWQTQFYAMKIGAATTLFLWTSLILINFCIYKFNLGCSVHTLTGLWAASKKTRKDKTIPIGHLSPVPPNDHVLIPSLPLQQLALWRHRLLLLFLSPELTGNFFQRWCGHCDVISLPIFLPPVAFAFVTTGWLLLFCPCCWLLTSFSALLSSLSCYCSLVITVSSCYCFWSLTVNCCCFCHCCFFFRRLIVAAFVTCCWPIDCCCFCHMSLPPLIVAAFVTCRCFFSAAGWLLLLLSLLLLSPPDDCRLSCHCCALGRRRLIVAALSNCFFFRHQLIVTIFVTDWLLPLFFVTVAFLGRRRLIIATVPAAFLIAAGW